MSKALGNYAPTGTIQLSYESLNFDGKKISKPIFEFDMKTITQENKDLQNHLRNKDFFDVEKWYTLKPELFKIKPEELKNKIVKLNENITVIHQQPCET